MRLSLLFVLVFLSASLSSDLDKYVGTYGDYLNLPGKPFTLELELRQDGTFSLKTANSIFPDSLTILENHGNWIHSENEVTLNPHLTKRSPRIELSEKRTGRKDSIEIRINHFVETYEKERLIETTKIDFNVLTLYIGKRKNYLNLVREDFSPSSCYWAPRVKNRIVVDSSNTFRIPKDEIQTIGLYTMGFTDFVEVSPSHSESDFIEINIVVPVDKEQMPRSKKIIVKGNRAYYHELKGKVNTFLLEPLIRKNS